MDDTDCARDDRPAPPRWAIPLILLGLALVALSVAGLLLLKRPPTPAPVTPTIERTTIPTAQAGSLLPDPTSTPAGAHVERQMPAPPTRTPTPQPAPTATRPDGTPIAWTEAEKNALSWMCWYEVGGMGSVRVDACLSTISTVRARYAYPNAFAETDVLSTLLREGQFNIEIDTSQPAPDPEMYWTVEQYQKGMRGSCNGYLYFDSVPGGPALCVIRSETGLFLEFHNGWD